MLGSAERQFIDRVLAEGELGEFPKETRAHPREAFRSEVDATPIERVGGALRARLTRACAGIDLSAGGARILWRGGPPGDRVVLHLKLKGQDPMPLECKVAWKREAGPLRWELGLSFRGRHPVSVAEDREAEAAEEARRLSRVEEEESPWGNGPLPDDAGWGGPAESSESDEFKGDALAS